MINEEALKAYLKKEFKDIIHVDSTKLGSGVQGSGFLIEMKTTEGIRSYVVKTLLSEGLGHDYPSDRAAVFLLDLHKYKNLPNHVKAIDVLTEMEDGSIKSIGGGKEYYLLMERGIGRHYFNDLSEFYPKDTLENSDIEKIEAMASYLADIHAVKKSSKTLYWRKLRDTVGHGECLMGVFDTYPDGTLSYDEMAGIIKKSVDWIAKLKPKYNRLCQVHGDFHPGNIWFRLYEHPLVGQGTDHQGKNRKDPYDMLNVYIDDFKQARRSAQLTWERLQKASIFVDIGIATSLRNVIADRATIRRIYCPAFKTTLTSSEHLNLTRDQFEYFMDKPKEFCKFHVRKFQKDEKQGELFQTSDSIEPDSPLDEVESLTSICAPEENCRRDYLANAPKNWINATQQVPCLRSIDDVVDRAPVLFHP